MATHGVKRPARKLPPKAVATPPRPAPLTVSAVDPVAPPVTAAPVMTPAEAAPALPPADISAAPLADVPDPAPIAIEPVVAMESAPVAEAAEPVAGQEPAIDMAASVSDATAPIVPVSDLSPIDSIVTTQKEDIMDATTAAAATTEKTQAFFADAGDRTRGAMEKGTKFFQEITEFSKGNVEAMVESSKIAARGFETMGQDAAAYAKTSFESASQAMRTMSTLKSPTEFMKFQADYARSVFDSLVAQTSRGTEASLKLAGDVAQPISNRVAVAAEKMKVVA